jgi:hypothetical protein
MHTPPFLLPLLALVLLFGACSKRTTDARLPKGKMTAEKVYRQLAGAQVNATWMDAKASVDFDGPDMSVGGTAHIKVEAGKRIWMRVSKFGFEAARALITPDSIYVIDRLNREYAAEPLSYVEKRFNIPARFELLQDILLGNPIFFGDNNYNLATESNQYLLQGGSQNWKTSYWLDRQDFRFDRMRLLEPATDREVDLRLAEYAAVTGSAQKFAYLRNLTINSSETGRARIQMKFNRVSLNEPTPISFNIPDNYSKE